MLEATTTDELEQARVRYLGRKAELPQILRASRSSRPRSARSSARPRTRPARRSRRCWRRAARRSAGAELEERLAGEAIDVTLPGEPLRRPAACTC